MVNRSLGTGLVVVPDLHVHLYDVDLFSLLIDVVAVNDDVEARLLHLRVADD